MAILLILATGAVDAHASADVDACFIHAAQKRHIDVDLVRAVAKVETDFQPWRTNLTSGAMGLMQIMPAHLKWLRRYGIEAQDLYDACTSINVGTFLLADFVRMYRNTWRAVGAYGAGMKPEKEAARLVYARKVQRAYAQIQAAKGSRALSAAQSLQPTQPGSFRPILLASQTLSRPTLEATQP